MSKIIENLLIELFRTKWELNKIYLLIICLNLISLVKCSDKKKSIQNKEDYDIYNNVANIISTQQQYGDQTDFKPSNWTTRFDRLRKRNRLASDIDKFRRLQEYKYLRSKNNADEDSRSKNYQFKRRSDLDDDYYYAPSSYYSPSSSNHYGLVYPPTAVQSIISLPPPTIVATPSPSYYPHSYRKYRPSASRNYYQRVYPNNAALHRRLSASPSSLNYETTVPYHHSPSTAYHSYLYGTGLAPQPSHYSYSQAPSYPNSHGLAHSAEHNAHENKELQHLPLAIITLPLLMGLLIPLLTIFFTSMISPVSANCCQKKERTFADVRTDVYQKAKDIWSQVEKAIVMD